MYVYVCIRNPVQNSTLLKTETIKSYGMALSDGGVV